MSSTAPSRVPCSFLVQATVRGDAYERLQRACAANGNPFYRINVIPFSTELPADLPEVDRPFVLFGYTTLLLLAHADPFWKRGVFFNPKRFCHNAYRRG